MTKKDILAFVESRRRRRPRRPQLPSRPPAARRGPAARRAAAAARRAGRSPARRRARAELRRPGESIEPMSAMRRGIAEHMRRSLDTSAHVTSAIEVDMSKVVAVREKLKREYQASYGVNPTYLSFIARATVETIRDWPWVNAEIRGDVDRDASSYVNLGFAVSLEGGKGLIVPVLKNAEGMNLLGIARGIADLAERARTKKLTAGRRPGRHVHDHEPGRLRHLPRHADHQPAAERDPRHLRARQAAVGDPDDAGNDAIAIRPMMNITLTYDHRLVDGAYGAQFLRDLRGRSSSRWDEGAY